MKVLPTSEPNNVKVTGPGDKPVPASMPVNFTVDTKTAGYGDLEVGVVVSNYFTQSHFYHYVHAVC